MIRGERGKRNDYRRGKVKERRGRRAKGDRRKEDRHDRRGDGIIAGREGRRRGRGTIRKRN